MMKKILFIPLFLLLLSSCSNTNYKETKRGIIVDMPYNTYKEDSIKIAVEVLAPTVIKIVVGKNDSMLKVSRLIAE